jgi:hypothetical protein
LQAGGKNYFHFFILFSTARIYNVSRKDPYELWVGLNDKDARWHYIYKLNISTGKLTLLLENKDRLSDVNFDWNENLWLATPLPKMAALKY